MSTLWSNKAQAELTDVNFIAFILRTHNTHFIIYCHFQSCAILQLYIPEFPDCLIAHHTVFIPYDTFWSDKMGSKQGGQLTEFYPEYFMNM